MADILQNVIKQGNLANSNDLSDVVLSAAAQNEVLVRNGSSQWVNQQLDLASMADRGDSTLVGRGDGGTGVPQQITVGSGLSMTGTTLTASAGSPALNDITDVTIAGESTDEVLIKSAGDWVNGTINTNSITNNAVSFAKQATLVQGRLIGRGGASGTGIPELLTIGSGLAMAGTELSATGGGGGDTITVDGSATAATDVDLDSATPAAPAGGVNITWAKDALDPTNVSAHLAAGDVAYSVIQDTSAASRLIGRGSASGAGDVEELTLGTGLTMNTLAVDVDADIVTKVYRVGHSYLISGSIAVPSGETDFIVPFFVQFAAGQTANLVTARHSINAGTSVTVNLQRNGGTITGYSGVSVTTTPTTTTQTQALTSDDEIALVVTGVSGSPFNMNFTIFIEYSQ